MRTIVLCTALMMPCVATAQSLVAVEPQATSQAATPQPVPGSPAIVDLDVVVVAGSQPGPGLWRVSKGDHVLWILGTQSPLPRRMEWDAGAVEQAISQSQEVIAAPGVKVKSDIGFFTGLTLIPSALKARRNPDGRSLQQVVAPDQYARWQALKAKYIGRDRGIEKWRPAFAAMELYDEAIEKSGMAWSGIVGSKVTKMARRHGLKMTSPDIGILIPEPRKALKEFAASSLDDLQCFEKTLDSIEGDLGNMAARANAWATGDIDTLRQLPANNQYATCMAAFTGAGLARKYGVDDLAQQVQRKWLSAAENAVANNASTFAMLPISQLLKADGYLEKLRARGYEVQAP